MQQNVNVVFIGNPGSGKSTILNCLVQQPLFSSGVSTDGLGITTILQKREVSDINYIDTPGLDDMVRREECAEQISAALRMTGMYYIVFVLTLESGRIRPADKTTMTLVLRSAPQINVHYGVIFNKLESSLFDSFSQDPEIPAVLINSGSEYPVAAPNLFFLEMDFTLYDAKDAVPPYDEALHEWLSNLPPVVIQPENVKKIEVNLWEEAFKRNAELLNKLQVEMKNQTESFKALISAERERAEAQYNALIQHQKQMEQTHAAQMAAWEKRLQESQQQANALAQERNRLQQDLITKTTPTPTPTATTKPTARKVVVRKPGRRARGKCRKK